MKSTPEERQSWKEGRRIRNIKKLLRKIDARCARSEYLSREVEIILKRVSESGMIQMQIDAIRRAN